MTITVPNAYKVARDAEMIALSGEDYPCPYDAAIRETELAIRDLRLHLRELKALKSHRHEWSGESGFCSICGADGNV